MSISEETKEVQVQGESFIVKQFPVMVGLDIQHRLMSVGSSPELIREIICKGAQKGSVNIDEKKFDKLFKGKYKQLYELRDAVLAFNFGDMGDDPLDESEGTEES